MPRIIQLKWGGLHQCYPSVVHNSYWEGGLKNAGVGGEREVPAEICYSAAWLQFYTAIHTPVMGR